MSHCVGYEDYHCSVSQRKILKDLNNFAYDPQESSGYHGNLKFKEEPVYKNRAEAMKAIEQLDNGWYDDWAVRYRDGRKIYWLVKYEYHC